jgi:hypothetical protein
MAKKPNAPAPQPLAPVVNVSMIGELNVYIVHEHELDRIAEGSPVSLAFNGAIALISVGVSLLLTVTTTTIAQHWLFNAYLFACINFLLVGAVLLAYWWRTRTSVRDIVQKIKRRMPPPPGIQEPMPVEPADQPPD